MRKVQFANGEIYHIYNRGVEKRITFQDNLDYLRFLNDLFDFNDARASKPSTIRFTENMIKREEQYEARLLKSDFVSKSDFKSLGNRNPLVEILEFVLMPNHFHLLIRQLVDDGISKFMQKMSTGYTNYFNTKYKRTGCLFQGRFKAVHIENDTQLFYIFLYIHLNPLDLQFSEWREQRIKNPSQAYKCIEQYRWSSYRDYIGKKNFPVVIRERFYLDFFGGYQKIKKATEEWIQDLSIKKIENQMLDA